MSSPPTDPDQPRKPAVARWANHPLIACLLLIAATILAFWPVVHADFINYDDTDYVTANARVQTGLTWKSAAWAFTTNHASNWHPLTWLSHMLDVQLFGQRAAGPHCMNLLLHTLNSVLVFCFLRRVTSAHWRSFVVAGLFALHPLHVESVAWVAERKDVLSTFFGMLTLLAYARYVGQSGIPGLKSKTAYGFTLLFFLLSLMSKPMLVTLPFVMLLLDFWPLHRFELSDFKQQPRPILGLIWEKIPFLMFSIASCVVTTWAQQKAMPSLEHLSLVGRIENTMVSYARYLVKAFWPVELGLPYLHPGHWPTLQVALATILVAGLCVAAGMTVRRHPYIFTGWFWYLGTLVPVIGLVQVGAQSMADRYTYVPLIGVFIILIWGANEVCARWRMPRPVVGVVATLLLVGCGVLTRQQSGYWHNTERLFIHSANVTRDNFIALANVGGSLFERGKLDEAMGYYQRSLQINPNYAEAANSIGAVLASQGSEEAVDWFRKALVLQPGHADALFNMGNAMAKQGNSTNAVVYFQEALKIRPDNYEARNNLGNTLVKLGRIDDAAREYRLALDYKPDGALILKNLGEALAAQGNLDEAIRYYRRALNQTNDPGTHYSLGLALAVQGRWDEAIEQYSATLRLSPTNAEAQYNLGYAFKVKGHLDQSAIHLGEAVRLKPEFPLAHYNLGCVLADMGQRDQAIDHLREAVRLKPDYVEAAQRLKSLEGQANP